MIIHYFITFFRKRMGLSDASVRLMTKNKYGFANTFFVKLHVVFFSQYQMNDQLQFFGALFYLVSLIYFGTGKYDCVIKTKQMHFVKSVHIQSFSGRIFLHSY